MDQYIVSARKYRPLTFDTIVGQGNITNTLKNAIGSNHLAHAYLFCGPRGVGKTTCARIFAKTINCGSPTENMEACGQCESCVSFAENRSYNIHELDAASNNSVEDIRNLTEQVRIPPQVGKYSVYIIDEVHMLSQQAFNAFLKTLEEPPKHAVFILATTEKHKIIPTILSRCQIYDFNRMGVEHMVGHLEKIAQKEGVEYEAEALNIIAQKADGAMRDALSIFDQIVSFAGGAITYQKVIENLNVLDYDYYFRMVDTFLQNNVPASLLIFNEILDHGFDAHNFINGLTKHLRDLLMIKSPSTLQLIDVGPAIKEKYKEQTAKCSDQFIFDALDIANEFDLNYKISKDKRLHVELALVKLCNITLVQKKKTDDLINGEAAGPHIATSNNPSQTSAKQAIRGPSISTVASPDLKIPVAKPPKKSTPSIKEALNNLTQKPVEIQSDTVEDSGPVDDNYTESDFNENDMLAKWSVYAENLKKTSVRMSIALKNRKPVLMESYGIKVLMDNTAQENDFNRDVKTTLTSFLRKELRNSKIEILTQVEESESLTKKAYTDADKFEVMSKKNPALGRLKNEFNLDFE
jgi:DNA polymerase III subunit gamma/tau